MTLENPSNPSRLQFPATLETVLRQALQIARDLVAPESERIDRESLWPESALRALQQSGLAGLVVPERDGGLGFGLAALTQVCETLGRHDASTALCFGMHSVGTAVIAAKATASQRKEYLTPIAEGRHLTTLALSEPGSGAHFYLPETRLSPTPGGTFRITGTKSFVTNGGHADSYVVSTVAADPNAPPGQFSCVVVRDGTKGLSWRGEWDGIGMRGNSSRTADLNDAEVPASDLLGEEGDQIWYIFNVVAPYFLMSMAGSYLGLAQAALDEAVAHLRKRTYTFSGTTLSQAPVLQHRLGCLWALVERTRRLVYSAAAEGDAGSAGALLSICSAKAEVADCAVTVVNEAMTLTGGPGYSRSGRLERLLRDARASHIMAPTTDILRTWAGRSLLGLPLLGE